MEDDATGSGICALETPLSLFSSIRVVHPRLGVDVIHSVDDVLERGPGGAQYLVHPLIATCCLPHRIVGLRLDEPCEPQLVLHPHRRHVCELFEPLELGSRYRELFGANAVRLLDASYEVFEDAARLRAETGLATPDALHAATALRAGCALFVTNDTDFRRVEGLPIVVLDDLPPEESQV